MKHASMAVTAILVAGLTAAAFAKSPVPANYALWFTSGQVWAFQVDVLTEGLFDEKGKPGSSHKETAALSCKVTAARAFRTVAVSRIECKTKAAKPPAALDQVAMSGTYIATPGRVIQVGGALPTTEAAAKKLLADKDEWLASFPGVPKPGKTKRKIFDGSETSTTVANGAGWCITVRATAAHTLVDHRCFDAKRGVTSAQFENHGGSSVTVKLTRK